MLLCNCPLDLTAAAITNSLVSYIYRKAGTYYAYSPRTRTCDRLEYQGCGGNQNRFESQQDCADVCGARLVSVQTNPDILTVQTSGAVLSRGRRALDQDGQQESDGNSREFCKKFEVTYPDAAQIVKTLDKTTSKDIDAELIEELEAQVRDL